MNTYAFPRQQAAHEQGEAVQEGMTLRDYFAVHALPTLIMEAFGPDIDPDQVGPDIIAGNAYAIADAMLAARTKVGAS